LTLDWGKEVDDPRVEEGDDAEEGDEKEKESEETEPDEEEDPAAAPDEDAAHSPVEADWEYEEPFAVRLDRRTRWEQGRDCALRLHDASVPFVFGSAEAKPAEVLERVRTLVKTGLPAEAALAALTSEAARFLGVEQRLGEIAVGKDATFTLWRSDPLTDERASPAWIFVDGFPSEFERDEEEKKDEKDGAPAVADPTGEWELDFEGEGIDEASLVLEMEEGGALTGTIELDDPAGAGRIEAKLEGRVMSRELEVEFTIDLGEIELRTTLVASIEKDALKGESHARVPGRDEPAKQSFRGKRIPD
jgi:hypothetical protein